MIKSNYSKKTYSIFNSKRSTHAIDIEPSSTSSYNNTLT